MGILRNVRPSAPVVTGLLFIASPLGLRWALAPIAQQAIVYDPQRAAHIIATIEGLLVAVGVALLVFNRTPTALKLGPRLLILAGTVGVMIAAFEAAFPILLPRLPLNLQAYVPAVFRVLGQSSKIHTIPRNYIAILGDSYSQGAGDWLAATNSWANGPFHAGHLIAQALDRDVVSFGIGGAGSIESIVVQPLVTLGTVRRRFTIDDPAVLLIYFYEGNDLSDNLRTVSRYEFFDRGATMFTDGDLRAELARQVDRGLDENRLAARMLGLQFVAHLTDNVIRRMGGQAPPRVAGVDPGRGYIGGEGKDVGGLNIARVNGGTDRLHTPLQGPALELPFTEMTVALRVFGESLHFTMARLPRSLPVVVYVPSPLSIYEWTGRVAAQTLPGRPTIYSGTAAWARSDEIAAAVAAISRGAGAHFLDPRSELRMAARSGHLHGPRDWKHFNRRGYEVFAAAVVAGLRGIPEPGTGASSR